MKKIFCTMILLTMLAFQNICGAMEIEPANYNGTFDYNYPVVKTGNAHVDSMINEKILERVKDFFSASSQPPNSITSIVNYRITCSKKNILSITLLCSHYNEGAAHPSNYKAALNFDTRTGKLLGLGDLKKISSEYAKAEYSPKGITKKLLAYAKKNEIYLFPEFKGLESLPENFYFDENFHLHFIFQEYDVAPYAAGIIDLDATLD
ncbi:MAG: DUF3298 domain-containing protein [Selenomonadaceae bacterium]|nr:DUF3298 domain-containing protein [Selenomonadaceae bacterium]